MSPVNMFGEQLRASVEMNKPLPQDPAPAPIEDAGELARLLKIERKVQDCAGLVARGAKGLRESVAIAHALDELRELFNDDIMDVIRGLMGTRLGFRTDRDTPAAREKYGDYTKDQVREVCIEALIRGLRLTGNEFNVIGGGCYPTKEGFTRLLAEFPDLKNLEIIPEVPQARPGGAVVISRASWVLAGNVHALERSIPVRLNDGQGADVALGKADRKMKASIYARITGSTWVAEDGEDLETNGNATPAGAAAAKLAGLTTQAREQLGRAFGQAEPVNGGSGTAAHTPAAGPAPWVPPWGRQTTTGPAQPAEPAPPADRTPSKATEPAAPQTAPKAATEPAGIPTGELAPPPPTTANRFGRSGVRRFKSNTGPVDITITSKDPVG